MKTVSVFKAYDIRGIAGQDIDFDFSRRLGRSIVEFTQSDSISIGRDIRSSGETLQEGLVQGIRESGCRVLDLGVVPTGVVYRSSMGLDVDTAVAITASHNPPQYNGFKIVNNGLPIAGEALQQLKLVFDSIEEVPIREMGELEDCRDYHQSVIQEIVSDVGPLTRSVRVAVDGSNSVPGPFMVDVLGKLGADVVALNCSWDIDNAAHPADPTRPENMIQLADQVVKHRCEFGICVDGDGDRIGVVDENGSFIHPDRLIGLFASDILDGMENGVEDDVRTILFDVKCSMGVGQTIERHGGLPAMVRTGHSFMKKELSDRPDINFAGEMSGHFFFNDRWNGHDCSMYNSARLIELVSRKMSETGNPMKFSNLMEITPSYPSTGEVKVSFDGDRKAMMTMVETAFRDMEYSSIDGIRVIYPNGWYLCRPSNTEPILVMRAEGTSNSALNSILGDVKSRIGGFVDLSALS